MTDAPLDQPPNAIECGRSPPKVQRFAGSSLRPAIHENGRCIGNVERNDTGYENNNNIHNCPSKVTTNQPDLGTKSTQTPTNSPRPRRPVPGPVTFRLPVSPQSPSMAATMSFSDWRQANSESLMTSAEELLDKLDEVAELLTEIDSKYISKNSSESPTKNADEDDKTSLLSRLHDGVQSARDVVGVLKREKWRLSKREMSVELKIGELEDYKSHLKNDMSSMNQTLDALSIRIVQLENQLVEAQETNETLEAEIQEHRTCREQEASRVKDLQAEVESLRKEVKLYRNHTNHTLTTENEMVKNEVLILRDENQRLKELVRSAETHKEFHRETDGDYLARLTNDFLKELSSLEVQNTINNQQVITGQDNNLSAEDRSNHNFQTDRS